LSLFEIKCPLCKGTIWIDPATGKVVDHQSADHQKGDFNEFLKSRQKGVGPGMRKKNERPISNKNSSRPRILRILKMVKNR
jgi:hypothetical protein